MIDAPSYDFDDEDAGNAEVIELTEDNAEELMNMLNAIGG